MIRLEVIGFYRCLVLSVALNIAELLATSVCDFTKQPINAAVLVECAAVLLVLTPICHGHSIQDVTKDHGRD
jgi:hypothetical protein